jgi:hypothetical protein
MEAFRSMLKNGLLTVMTLVAGFLASSWWSARDARHAAGNAAASDTTPSAPAVDLGELRSLIRDELRQARLAAGPFAKGPGGELSETPSDQPTRPAVPERPRTPAQIAAHVEATTLIDDGLASGHWRDEDEARWVDLRDELARADAGALRLKLFQALNEGRVAGDFDIRRGGRREPPDKVETKTEAAM